MTLSALSRNANVLRNERAEKLLTQRSGPKANVPVKEVTHMPFGISNTDSIPNFKSGFVTGGAK